MADNEPYEQNIFYAHLELNQMYKSLTTLYSRMFLSSWFHFRKIAPAGVPPHEVALQMAQIYISHWFIDLYHSVRTCVNKISHVAFREHSRHGLPLNSNEYDVFLCHLNSVILPTHVVGCFQDSMYVPVFGDKVDPKSPHNPFGMEAFHPDFTKFMAIIFAMKNKKSGWKYSTLTKEPIGRPVWLFDWHSDNRVCSWFPMEGNYTSEDIMYAFVVGVACTPHLAHQNTELWQQLPDNVDPQNVRLSELNLNEDRHYYGQYEVVDYKIYREKLYVPKLDSGTMIATKRARRNEPSVRTRQMEGDDASGIISVNMIERQILFVLY